MGLAAWQSKVVFRIEHCGNGNCPRFFEGNRASRGYIIPNAWQDYSCRAERRIDAYLWEAAGMKGLKRPFFSRAGEGRASFRGSTKGARRPPPRDRSRSCLSRKEKSPLADFLTRFCRNWPRLRRGKELFIGKVRSCECWFWMKRVELVRVDYFWDFISMIFYKIL